MAQSRSSLIREGQPVVAGHAMMSDAEAMVRPCENALEAAVREHARLVYRVAYSVLRNHHDAEDATQETFVKVLRYEESSRASRTARHGLRELLGGLQQLTERNDPRCRWMRWNIQPTGFDRLSHAPMTC